MRLNEEFLKKFNTEKIAVNCETEEEAKQFLKWLSEESLMRATRWKEFKKETCYSYYECSGIIYYNRSWFVDELYTIIKFSDLMKPEYIVRKLFNLKTLYEYGFPWEAYNNLFSSFLCCKYFNIGDVYNTPALRKNIDWLIEKGFIEKIKEEFEPFDLTFRIDSKEELETLWNVLNVSISAVEQSMKKDGRPYKQYNTDIHDKFFEQVDEELKKLKC